MAQALFALLVLMIVSPPLLVGLGSLVLRAFGNNDEEPLGEEFCEDDAELERARVLVSFTLGLLLYLSGVFFLSEFGCPLLYSALVCLIPGLIYFGGLRKTYRVFLSPSFNFVLWFLVHLLVGASLFNSTGNITTIWVNNYGDLAFHLGMISSFVFGENFPVQNHLLAGDALSYPLFINLWSASLWQLVPEFSMLPVIFFYQWLLVWCAVYFLLNGDRFPLIPWALLLGGGAYNIVWRYFGLLGEVNAGLEAHQFLASNYPWTPFFTTIWVTQRSTLLGILFLFSISRLVLPVILSYSTLRPLWSERVTALTAGLLLGLAALAHSHFCLVMGVFTVLVLLLTAFRRDKFAAGEFDQVPVRERIMFLCRFSGAALCGLLFLPWLLSKASVLGFAVGWMPWQTEGVIHTSWFNEALASMKMWIWNAPIWLISIPLLGVLTGSWAAVFSILIVFVLANVTKLAIWEWDQLKAFLALYCIGLAVWTTGTRRFARLSQGFAVLLILPCCVELAVVLGKLSKFEVYSEEDLRVGKAIRDFTVPSAIILAKADHNSPVTLSGRRLFVGYDGTLSSHGLTYIDRKEMAGSLENILQCINFPSASALSRQHCPTHLVWTRREQTLYHREQPGYPEQFKLIAPPYLYQILPQVE